MAAADELIAEGLTEVLASPDDGLDKYDPEPDCKFPM